MERERLISWKPSIGIDDGIRTDVARHKGFAKTLDVLLRTDAGEIDMDSLSDSDDGSG